MDSGNCNEGTYSFAEVNTLDNTLFVAAANDTVQNTCIPVRIDSDDLCIYNMIYYSVNKHYMLATLHRVAC